MKFPAAPPRFVLAALAGLLLAAAFPNIGLAGFAWIAPGLLAAAAAGKTGWESFRIGYVGGFLYYLAALRWLLRIPYQWHGIPIGPAAGWAALSAFLALYSALWVWIVSESIADARAPTVLPGGPPGFLSSIRPSPIMSESWSRRLVWALSGAAAWVAIEMGIARFLSGFPWDLLGVSQYRLVPLIQVASFTGVYGVSFVVVWTSLSLLLAAVAVLQRPAARYSWLAEIILPLGAVFLLFAFGTLQTRKALEAERLLKVTFVQPSIPQTLIWDQSADAERFRQVIQLSAEALTNQTDLLLWPEASVPGLLRYNPEMFGALAGLARSNKVWIIVGADDAEPKKNPVHKNDADYFNSSFLIGPQGLLMGRYRKRNLVIFGEYIPLVKWLPFIKYFTPIESGFTPGDRPVPFPIPDLGIKTSVLICFEDVFPHLAREYAQDDIDFLVNLTNNGWFGEGAAQWQHATSAIFRAVENGLPLLRCSNNGLTCWVDQYGRLRQIFHDPQGSVYGKGIMTSQIPISSARRTPTFYHLHGDWFGWACVFAIVIRLGLRVWRNKASDSAGNQAEMITS